MKPVSFSDVEVAAMGDATRVTLAVNQPQYQPLAVLAFKGFEGRILSKWELSDEDRRRIADGAHVYIEMLTFGDPPMPILPSLNPYERCAASSLAEAPQSVTKADIEKAMKR